MEPSIWTEKYRPRTLDQIVSQKNIVERLKYLIRKNSLPHCLFAGPAGCGKTTAALAVANELYGDMSRGNFLELNASDERGIDTVRVKVKDFARTIPLQGFKIIYLDEADSLTKDAQHALRRTMENYSATCRFILACNYSGKIISPIQSRCAVFRFSSLPKDDMKSYLKGIAEREKMRMDEESLDAVVGIAEGDMRRAVNTLQMLSSAKDITPDVVYSVVNHADPADVRKMLELALSANFREAREILIKLLHDKGLSGEDVVREIHSQAFSLDVDDRKKLAILERLGEYEFRLTEGSNPRIQIEAFLAQLGIL
ncbi:MAG: replication factor C small subunit [Candidatus Aenigmarchaeota archaeon]|nr:replication factor C small subunit [Candidatus Aenigmarchaeota archaeon]